jgi:small subunit ribosomal protein S16
MAVKIRLARIGKKHVPFYRVVAIDSRKKRDGAFLQDLGTYDAINSSLVRFDAEGIKSWEAKGAVVVDSVKRLQKLHKQQQAV